MRRRSAPTAAFAVVLLVAGQLVALAHEAETRHVTCEEHGEQIEAAQLQGALDDCDHDHFIGADAEGGEHEDCLLSRSLHQSNLVPELAVFAFAIDVANEPAPPAITAEAPAADLYLIAPKTSPPAAS